MAAVLISEDEFIEVLKRERGEADLRGFTDKTLRGAVSMQFLCNVLKRRRHPGATLAKALGYEQVIGFRKIAPKPKQKPKK